MDNQVGFLGHGIMTSLTLDEFRNCSEEELKRILKAEALKILGSEKPLKNVESKRNVFYFPLLNRAKTLLATSSLAGISVFRSTFTRRH
ncbi:MAG: hypothetical protein ABID54_10495 [Pseudomonadota bacterium]